MLEGRSRTFTSLDLSKATLLDGTGGQRGSAPRRCLASTVTTIRGGYGREAATSAVDAEVELWKALVDGPPRPPANAAAWLTDCASLHEVLQGRSVALLKATTLAALADPEDEEARLLPRVFPRRQDLPKDAFWRTEDLFEHTLEGHIVLRPGHEIIAISHCWLSQCHPDPEGLQLDTLYRFIQAWTHTQPGLLLRRIAIYIDWCSLFQEPRSAIESDLFERARRHACLWYSHRKVRVWLLSSTPDGIVSYQRRGWTHLEAEVSMLKAMWGDEVLDIGRVETGARHLDRCWPLSAVGMSTLVNANLASLDGATFGICTVPRRPISAPKLFAKDMANKVLTRSEDFEIIIEQYNEVFRIFANSIESLNLSGLEWGDLEVEKFAQVLPHLRFLRELNLTNNEITELGAGDLADEIIHCNSLQKLFLTENDIQPGLEGSERLRETWSNAGKNARLLFLWYPEQSEYVKKKLSTS